jgi:hypothetical protein
VYICVKKKTYIYTYVYIYVYINIIECIYLYTYIHVCIYVFPYIFYILPPPICIHSYSYIYIYTYVYIYIYIYIHNVYTYICIYSYIYIYICIYIHVYQGISVLGKKCQEEFQGIDLSLLNTDDDRSRLKRIINFVNAIVDKSSKVSYVNFFHMCIHILIIRFKFRYLCIYIKSYKHIDWVSKLLERFRVYEKMPKLLSSILRQ